MSLLDIFSVVLYFAAALLIIWRARKLAHDADMHTVSSSSVPAHTNVLALHIAEAVLYPHATAWCLLQVTIHDYSIRVERLPQDATADELVQFFGQYGEVMTASQQWQQPHAANVVSTRVTRLSWDTLVMW